jgi:hypothetical protein
VRGEGRHAEDVVDPRVLTAEQVGRAGRAGLTGQRLVQRGWPEGQLRQPGLAQVRGAGSQVPGQVRLESGNYSRTKRSRAARFHFPGRDRVISGWASG